jgi:transposase
MISIPANIRIYLACGATDMRRGFDGLAVMVQEVLAQDPHSGALFAFRAKRGDLIKLLWWDGEGLCLFAMRLEKGRFVWPMAAAAIWRPFVIRIACAEQRCLSPRRH